jgi:outer membrane protein assembly factor BamB
VAGANGYLYALNASNLTLRWRSVIAIPSTKVSDYFDWSSPTVANGRIYVGVSSLCNNPNIRGGVIAYSQATGKKLAEFYTVPAKALAGSVWSSVAVAPSGDVFVSTANGPNSNQLLAWSESILKLNPTTLKVLGHFQVAKWQIGPDSDFGASPILFGSYVGACNKDGIFYALNQATMKVRWEKRIGDRADGSSGVCTATPAYNGKVLYFGGNETTINGVTYNGSAQARNPKTGALIWQTPLADGVTGSPSLDGGGVLAVPGYFPPSATSPAQSVYLINPASGQILTTLGTSPEFAQAVFAGGWLFTANSDGVYAWHVQS